jgi:hypothetical protein
MALRFLFKGKEKGTGGGEQVDKFGANFLIPLPEIGLRAISHFPSSSGLTHCCPA